MSTRKIQFDDDSTALELPADVDPHTTVWISGQSYHADRCGIPACPEHFDDLEESTLLDAAEKELEPCGGCDPVDYRRDDPELVTDGGLATTARLPTVCECSGETEHELLGLNEVERPIWRCVECDEERVGPFLASVDTTGAADGGDADA